jgi:predicted dehydrogenase
MIKHIHARGRYMQVIGASGGTYINAYSGSQGVGNLRFNTSSQQMEVYDGTTWTMLNTPDATVGLNDEAESLLDWAREKRNEEIDFKARMEKHPGLKEAYERLEIMKALTLQEEKQNG